MTKVIIYKNPNDTNVVVCIPTGEIPIEEVQKKDTPPGSIIVDYDELPKEEEFFNAWELNNGVVGVNLDKAKEIMRTELRIKRKPLLEEQDVLYMRATEAGQDTTAIVAEKQRLRDLTGLVDVATTLDELRNLKP